MTHEKQESFALGVSFTLLSSLGMSLIGLFGKIGDQIFSLTGLIFWRFFAAFIISVIFFWILGDFKRPLRIGNVKMHIMRACLVLIAQYSYYFYIEKGTLLNGTMLLCTGPLFIPLIEWVFLRKKVGHSTWISLVVSFIGVICILQPDREIFSMLSAMGLLSGICQGGSQVVFGLNAREERSDLGVLYLMFFSALFSLGPYVIQEAHHISESGGLWMSILLVIALGASSVFNQMSRAVAYRHGTPSKLAVFLYFSVVIAGFWDWLVFKDIPNILSMIGAFLVILGGILKIYIHSWRVKS